MRLRLVFQSALPFMAIALATLPAHAQGRYAPWFLES
jgi:hypothetical protein